MNIKKITAALLAILTLFGVCSVGAVAIGSGYASIQENIYFSEISFREGIGPETEGYSIDYVYMSPAVQGDTTKYPLVIWLHGIGNGSKPTAQLSACDIEAWGTYELQRRFKDSGGAFIFVPRSLEEKGLYWADSLIYPLRAAIDDFIKQNKANIDISRIYVGGYSMGGKMALKMAVAYPEMFAAVFPVCPAWVPNKDGAAKIADMPMWLTSGRPDPTVNYYAMVMPVWENVISQSNVPEKCRFSTLSKVTYPDGTKTYSAHLSWYSVNYDMFSSEDGAYPYMTTVDGNGNTVTLTYPDGMISWLSGLKSDYDGSAATDGGNIEAREGTSILNIFVAIINFFKNIFLYHFKGLK